MMRVENRNMLSALSDATEDHSVTETKVFPGLSTQSVSVLRLRFSTLTCKTSTETAYLKIGQYFQKKNPEQLFTLFRVIS